MPSPPSSTAPARVVRRTLADGTVKEYRYARTPAARHNRCGPDSLAALISAYARSPEFAAKRPATRANYRVYLRDLDELGAARVTDLRRRDLLAVRDAIAGARGHGAANVFISVASVVFSWAVTREWLDHAPTVGIRALPGGALRPWTAAQADLALTSLPEAYRRVVLLARYTGQRRGDLCAMRWSAYDGQRLRLTQQKTSVALVIPCHPVLRAELDRWRREASSLHILTTPRGLPWRPMLLTQALPARLQAIGLPPLTVHGLRKLAATELAEAGCSVHEIAAITGHRTLSMVQHYTRSAEQEHLADAAISRLENARENARKTPRKALKSRDKRF